jgi:hypothetical protein
VSRVGKSHRDDPAAVNNKKKKSLGIAHLEKITYKSTTFTFEAQIDQDAKPESQIYSENPKLGGVEGSYESRILTLSRLLSYTIARLPCDPELARQPLLYIF